MLQHLIPLHHTQQEKGITLQKMDWTQSQNLTTVKSEQS